MNEYYKHWDKFLPEESSAFLESVSHCPGCGSGNFINLPPVRPAGANQCLDCGLVFLSPRLSPAIMHRLYLENTGSLSAELNDQLEKYMSARYDTMKREMFFADKIPGLTLIDIGCGWGHFLKKAGEEFLTVEGLELSEKQSGWAARNLGIDVVNRDVFAGDFEKTFSVISLWEVIEHVSRPRELLQWCFNHLEPGGQLVLSTPNYNSIFRRLLGLRWYYHIPTQHPCLFTPTAMKHSLTRAGFKRFKIITDGRSRLTEKNNRHNQVDPCARTREQWLQSFALRSETEQYRRAAPDPLKRLNKTIDRISWHFFKTLSKAGLGDQMRVFALR
ncbi:class I SAM-dependent methyltransferase [Fibrobacterota bacterium]